MDNNEHKMKRGLKSRHMQMIALGEENLVSSEFREITALHQLGLLGYLLNYFCRFFKTL